MAISIVSTVNGLANRWGALIAGQNEQNTLYGTTLPARTNTITGLYLTAQNDVVQGIYSAESNYQGTGQTQYGYYQGVATQTMIEQVNANYNPPQSFSQSQAIVLVNNQLVSTASGFQKPTVAYTGTAGAANTGNAVLSVSLQNQYGVLQDYLFAESISLLVTSDSGHNGGTAFQETVTWLGAPPVNSNAYNWPQGSGATGSLQETNGDSTTLISNGGFEAWPTAALPPTGWTIATGTANTNVVRSTGTVFTGTYSCSFIGDGATLYDIYQAPSTLQPTTVYGFSCWLQLSASATGALEVALNSVAGTTGTPGTPSLNYSGASNSQIINMSAVNHTGWTNFSGFFQTPYLIPSGGLFFEIWFSTVLQSGKTLFLDKVAFAPAIQWYPGGPYCNIFSGSIASLIGDSWVVQVSNTGGTNSIARNLDRWWNIRTSPPAPGFLQFNSVTAGYIADSLIL